MSDRKLRKFRVTYWEDEWSCVAETEIEAFDETDLKIKANNYYDSNLKNENIAGARWAEIFA